MSEEPEPKEPEKRKRGPRVWHAQQEKILKTWGEASSCYRYMHNKAFQKFKKQSMWFTLPIIVISTITGTANFAQSVFPPAWVAYVPLVIGAFNLVAAIMTTVLQFLKVNELMESHRSTSIQYGKLARNIRLELAMPLTERKHDGYNMVEICRAEYDRLIEQSPPVPKSIVSTFEEDVKNDEPPEDEKFTRPEILTIRPIELFDREAEEARLREKHLRHLEELKKERELRFRAEPGPKGWSPLRPMTPKRVVIEEIQALSNRHLVTSRDPLATINTDVPTRPASVEQIEIDIPPEEPDTREEQ